MLAIRTILHPTDFSNPSKSAFELACALARDHNSKLVLIHVVPPTRVFAPDGIAIPMPADEPGEVRTRLENIRPTNFKGDVERHVLEGDPAATILQVAEASHADLIVMGTHGTTGLTRLLVGSVAESVMRKSPCPVLTVKGEFRLEANAK